MKEAVVFLFIQNQKVLVEFRFEDNETKLLIPGGGIEHKDVTDAADYREIAMHREVFEEFAGSTKIREHTFLGTVQLPETGMPYHVYVVSSWEGNIPAYTVEEGIEEGKLEWLHLDEAIRQAKNTVAKYALEKVKEHTSVAASLK